MLSLTLNGETIIRQRNASHLGNVVGVDSHNTTIGHAVNDLTFRVEQIICCQHLHHITSCTYIVCTNSNLLCG